MNHNSRKSSPKIAATPKPFTFPATALCWSLLVFLCATAAAQPARPQHQQQQLPSPPKAEIRNVTDEYFGVKVTDPYRWLEDVKAPEAARWIKAQADYARRELDRLPLREQILQELNRLSDAGAIVADIRRRGNLFFYVKRNPGEQDNRLYVREGLDGAERLLFDPDKISGDGKRYSLIDWNTSWDGKYLTYLAAPGGTEDGEIRVVETATGRDTGERIDRAGFFQGEWLPDGKSFLYGRFPAAKDGEQIDVYQKNLIYRHVLGADPASDKPVFGFGVDPKIEVAPEVVPVARTSPAWKYVFVMTQTVTPNLEIYYAPVEALDEPVVPWRKIASFEDEISSFAPRGDDLYLMTFKQTPRFKVVRTSLSRPDVARAETVYAGGGAIVEAVAAQPDALYVQTFEGGSRKIQRLDYLTKKAVALEPPYPGSASIASTPADVAGVYFSVESWTRSTAHFKYDPETGASADTKLILPIPVDMSDIEVTSAKARSHDGTLVPLVILHKKGLRRDGSNPTLMWGYGAYGFENTSPSFAARHLPWLRRGGVLVFTGVRGGGEYGEEWHRGGMKETKSNTWKDFIACGEYLVAEKYTSPRRLSGLSYSAGGILIGRAITERPDLFGAAIVSVGDTNPIRMETSTGGALNTTEFGTVKLENEFKALYEMDTYHHVKDGVRYPAVLFTHGFNDPRVPVWTSAKTAARLQAASASGKPVLLRIDYDAGHGGFGASQRQRNETQADIFAFLFDQLK